MKVDCDVIRDLLPLYADKACSERSCEIVEEHLQECVDCRNLVNMLLTTEIEDTLHSEEESVLQYGIRQFRRRSAAVGSAVSGAFTIPILICLAMNLVIRPTVSWVGVVMAACCVLASLIAVPLMVKEDRLFWTFCAFTASLMLLLGVTCLYSNGDWFGVASSAVLFGLSVLFLPFVLRARPVRMLIGKSNRLLIVLGVDVALFFNCLNMIDSQGKITLSKLLFTLGILGGIVSVAIGLYKNRKTETKRI